MVMTEVEVISRKRRIYRGCGYLFYKSVDSEGERIFTLSIVTNWKQRIILAYTKDGWYDGEKSNRLKFKRIDRTIYLKRTAIRLIKSRWKVSTFRMASLN